MDLNRGDHPAGRHRGLSPRLIAWLAWVSCLLSVVLIILTLVLDVLVRHNENAASQVGRYAYVTLALPISVVGALITFRRSGNRIGLLMLVGGLSIACDQFAFDYVRYGVSNEIPAVRVVGWIGNWMWVIPPTTLLFTLLLFPNGHLPSRRWRPLAWLVGGWSALTVGLATFGAGVYNGPPLDPHSALPGRAGQLLSAVMPAMFGLFPLLLLAAAASAVVRFRHAQGDERSQLTWLAYAGSLVAFVWFIPRVHQVGTWERAAADILLWLVPAAIGIAVLRYRLYEIDRIVNRTIVYAVLTGCVGGTYVLAVTLLGAVFEQKSGLIVSLVASALVAVFFAPLRARLQRAVDRLLYGQRREPFAVVSRLGSRLEAAMAPDDVLPTIVETVGQALKLPYAAIELRRDGRFEPVYVRGTLTGEPIEFALTYRGETLGRLVVGPRAPNEPYSPSDQRLLRDLARHAGIAVHAARLTADLQRSRERLVTTREEERRRLRRDLHDGLGPTLAGMAFQVEAASRVLPAEPERAKELLEKLKTTVKQTIAEVHQVVDGLRPPALDELGLVRAIRQHGAQFAGTDSFAPSASGAVAMDVRAPASMPQLPAAVEVAVYRIATEAITNVLRHSDARHCTVNIRLNDTLELEVVDDGHGMDTASREGVGLSSMRERAAELGGSCVTESSATTGTRIFVRLPIALEG